MRHLEREPFDVDALALMSRLCLLGDDISAAIACAALAVRTDPGNTAARAAFESACARRPNPALGRERLQQALELEPELEAYNACYGSAPPYANGDRLRALLDEALRLDPGLGAAHYAFANLLGRGNDTLGAVAAYRRGLDIDPRPDAALALSELLFDIGEAALSDRYRAQALSQQRVYLAGPRSRSAKCSVLVLQWPAPWAYNTPLEYLVDPREIALHRFYLTGDPVEELPPHDVIFNAIGEAERAHPAIERAQRFISNSGKRTINQPAHLRKTARPHLAGALAGVHGCAAVQTRRLPRKELQALGNFPMVIRPIDTHAGRGLERVDDADALSRYLAQHGDERFDAAPFVDYRSRDGFYRKYRVVLVDGEPYPYHLGISPHWMVHYVKTPTGNTDWMRAEEERFLSEPACVFPDWQRTFTQIAQAIGLDYFGIDCTLLPDGTVLVFEADAAMLVHCREDADSYKHRYIPRIFRALQCLLTR